MNMELIEQFTAIVGERYTLRDADDITPHVTDMRGRLSGSSPLVLRPGTVEEISQILKLATKTGTPIIPQGGNTGLVGAGLPLSKGDGNEVIVSLGRMNKIVDVNTASNTMTVEAGAVLETIQNAADEADRLFPLSLGAQGTCQIGGNIGSNAGGTGVLAYGNTRDLIMGLEVVLPTGEIWNGLSQLRKDNTGYDLKNLFTGAEGTLGIVTKAVLKLFPKPLGRELAFVAIPSPQTALELLTRAKSRAGNGLTTFELIADIALEVSLKHAQKDSRRPIEEGSPWYVLMEISSGSSSDDARSTLEAILEAAFEDGLVEDAALAASLDQQTQFWALREGISKSQGPEGASIKHDIAIPVGHIPAFIEEADRVILDLMPAARVVNFGHMGDGNLHYNVSQPVEWDREEFLAQEHAIHNAVYEVVGAFGGSISAEHGIGQIKCDRLEQFKDPTALMMMRAIKATFDPAGIMNPGKVLNLG